MPASAIHARFSFLFVSIALGIAAMAASAPVMAEGIAADKTAPKNQQATLLQTVNGTPQINIQTPTQAGVSVNQFRQFDIDKRGAILNNSRQNTQTQLGGWIQGNPWLAGGEARVIVNQVNSANPSLLNGYIEVGGRRSEVVIANPAGIQVNGAGFINASRATLSTGTPKYQADTLTGFQVRQGNIAITGQGLDTRDSDYTRILSQTAQINAPVWGKDIQVVTGQNDGAAAGSSPALEANTNNTPAFAIDTGALGGMYANKITLISTAPDAAIRNQGKLFAAAGNVAIDAAGNLINSSTVRSSGEAVFKSTHQLSNERTGDIQAGRLDIQTAQLDNAGSIIQTGNQKLTIDAQGKLDNHGRIGLADTAPTANAGSGSASSGATAAAPATAAGSGSVKVAPTTPVARPALADGFIQTRGSLNNSGSIRANGETQLTAHQGLNNTAYVDVQQLNVTGIALNNNHAHIRAAEAAIQTQQMNNQQGKFTAGKQLTIQAQHIDNQQGKILAAGNAHLHVSSSLNNRQQGKIAANQTLNIHDNKRNTLSIDNTDGTIQSGDTLIIQSRALANNGIISAGNRASIQLQNSFTVERDMSAGNHLSLSSAGTLTNTQALKAGQSVTLHGGDIINQAGGSVQAGQTVQAAAQHDLTNRGLFNSHGLTHLRAGNSLSNIGTGKIYGNHVALLADSLTNKEETIGTDTKTAVIAARERLDIGARNITNQEAAVLSSEGDLAIGGSLDANQHAAGMAESLINSSARIEAQGDGRIAVKQLQNVNNHLKLEEYLAAQSGQIREYTTAQTNTYYQSGKDGYFDNSNGKKNQKIASFHLNNGQRIDANQWHVRDYHKETYQEKTVESQPAQIIIGGHLKASGQNWVNQDSQIMVGGDLIADDLTNGHISNDATLGKGRIERIGTQWDSVTQKKWYSGKKRPRRVEINHGKYHQTEHFTHAFNTPISIIAQNTQIGANQQTVAALNHHTPPAAGNIVSLNKGTIQLPGNSLYTIAPNSRGWIVETDPAFTNYRQWLGSDYMLSVLQNDPNQMHKRLGDGYYEQKLINEQIQRLTGFRRLDGYSNDEVQFKALMQSGITASQTLGLTPGIALSPEQVSRLTSDIVWLETQTVTLPDGRVQNVLVPKVYIAARQGYVNASGSLMSAKQIHLDVKEGTIDNSGTIAGRQAVILNARGINHSGQLQADKIALTASNGIHFTGGTAQAGSALAANAQNIYLDTTTKSAGNHQNGTTAVDRAAAVSVRGNKNGNGTLALHAHNDLHLNAAAISNTAQNGITQLSAGNQLNLGTISTEVHETSGALSDRNHRHVHQTEEIGSQIQTQGNVLLHAGKDINIRQGTLNSQNGQAAIKAGRGIHITEGRQTLDMDVSLYAKSNDIISSTQTLDQYQGYHDEALGSDIGGKQVIVAANNDIAIRGSNVVSDDLTSLSAVQDVRLSAAQNTYQDNERHEVKQSGFSVSISDGVLSVGYNKSKTDANIEADSTTVSGSQIGSIAGNTQITAGNQITAQAASIGAGQDITLQAKDITLGNAYEQEKQHSQTHSKNSGIQLNLDLKAPELRQLEKQWDGFQAARQTRGTLQRERTFHKSTINAAAEPWKPAASFYIGSSTGSSGKQSHITRAIGSRVNAGGKVRIQASAGDANIIGSQIFGQQGTDITAANNINIAAAEEQTGRQTQNRNKNAGISDSGNFSVFIGTDTDTASQQQGTIIHNASIVGSGTGRTSITAGGTYSQTGSQLTSDSDIDIHAKQINISAADNPYFNDAQHTFTQKGITAGVSSPIIQAIQTAQAAGDASDKVGESKNTRTNIMAAANAGWQAYQTAQALNPTAAGSSKTAGSKGTGIGINITYGEQHNQNENHIRGSNAQDASIQADGTVKLTAAGGGKNSDIRIKGADIAGKQGTHLSADNQIHMSAAAQNHSERSSSIQHGWNAGAALDFSNGFSLGVTAGGNYGKGYGNGAETTHLHNRIGDTHSQTTLSSGGDTTLNGTQVHGKGVQISAQDLTIESPQDSAVYHSKQQSGSAQITVGYGFSGSAEYSQSKINAEHASISKQSGIFAGDDGYQITIQDRTSLKGGLITSTQNAEDSGKNQFSTGTLTASNIQNHSRYEGESFGIGISGSISGETLGQGKSNTPAESGLSTIADTNNVGKTLGYGNDRDSQNSITHSGINTRNISITDEAKHIQLTGLTAEQTKAKIHTNTTTDTAAELSGRLNNHFDKEAVQKELDLQRKITQEFDKTRQSLKSDIRQEAERAKQNGETERAEQLEKLAVAVDMLAGGLYTPSTSVIGSAANSLSPALSYQIGQWAKANHKEGSAEHIAAHAALATLTASVSGNDALSAALAAGGAEAAAPILAQTLYGKPAGQLSAKEKDNIASLAGLLGSVIGASIGKQSTDFVSGASAASQAVEENFLGALSQARLEKARDNLSKGRDSLQDDNDIVKLNQIDQASDYLLGKWQSGEKLSEYEIQTLQAALEQYYLENKQQYDEEIALKSLISLRDGEAGYRPFNYVYPFAGSKAQKEQWEKDNPDKVSIWRINQGQAGVELSKIDTKARGNLQAWHTTEELGNIGLPAIEFTTGGLGNLVRGLSAFNSGVTIGDGINKINAGETADGVVNIVFGGLGVAGTVGATNLATRYVSKTAIPKALPIVNESPNGISFNINYPNHLAKVDGFTREKGIKGGHNRGNFLPELEKHNGRIIREEPTGVAGITRIYYEYPKLDRARNPTDSYKPAPKPKTVYDPAKFSDEQIMQWGQKAAAKGYEKNFIKNGDREYTETVNGIPFRVYVNPKTGAINNVYPE